MQIKFNKQSLLYNYFAFLKHPKLEPQTKHSFVFKLLKIFRLYSFAFVFIILAGILLSVLLSLFNFQSSDNAISALVENESLLLVAFLAVIYAPINEELAFRLALKPSRLRIAISLSLLINLGLSLLNLEILQNLAVILLLTIFLIIIFYVILRFIKSERLNNFFKNRFRIIFYLSVFLFGAVHIGNYTNLGQIWIILPFLFLPQLIAGAVFGYVRVKFGLIYSIFSHMLHNLITLTPLVLITLAGIDIDSPTIASNLTLESSVGVIFLCGIILIILLVGLLLNIYNVIELFRNMNSEVQKRY